jgi:hypothetical protein
MTLTSSSGPMSGAVHDSPAGLADWQALLVVECTIPRLQRLCCWKEERSNRVLS